jgi:hypothetical protein
MLRHVFAMPDEDGKIENRNGFPLVFCPLGQKRGKPRGSAAPQSPTQADRSLVRNIHYLVRLNTYEDKAFQENLARANGLKPPDFIRQFMTKGYVQAPVQKSDKVNERLLLKLLIEFRTNFKRISNFMKYKDPQLAQEAISVSNAIQKIIERI